MCLISRMRILKSGVFSLDKQKQLNDPCRFSPPGFVSWPSALPIWAPRRPIIRASPPGKWVMGLRLWDYGPGDVWFLNPAAHGKKRKHTTCPPLDLDHLPFPKHVRESSRPHERHHSISRENNDGCRPLDCDLHLHLCDLRRARWIVF